eukprot:gene14376-19281_t
MSITSFGPSTVPEPPPKPFVVKQINEIGDIDGARSSTKYKHYYNKPQPQQSDVDGSTPKVLIRGRNVRDNSLYIDDIDGARRTVKDRMMLTNRRVDPLNPDYVLPTFVPNEAPVQKFIKDPQYISDIEGTAPKPKVVFATRDTFSVDDIVGAQAGWKPRHVKARLEGEPHDIMQAQDVSVKNHRYVDKTSRVTDVMNPVYSINGMTYQDDKYTKPKSVPKFIPDSFFMKTKDINDYVPQTESFVRREYRNTNFIGDIEGAKADTIKKGITTNRTTNPLQPVYQALDPGEVLKPVIYPLIPPELIKVPKVRSQSKLEKNNLSSSGPVNNFTLSNEMDGGFDNEYDPVTFTGDLTPTTQSRPAPNKQLKLEFQPSGNNSSRNGIPPLSNRENGYTSARLQPGANSGRSKSVGRTTAMNVLNSGSHAISARNNDKVMLSPSMKRAMQERLEEIQLVRQLTE